GRLRREIEAVSAADFMRFLFRWQHVQPGSQLHGRDGVLQIIGQLQGMELPAPAWEEYVIPERVRLYDPADLEHLCLSGTVTWGRLSAGAALNREPVQGAAMTEEPSGAGKRRQGPGRNSPIAFVLREDLPAFRAYGAARSGPYGGGRRTHGRSLPVGRWSLWQGAAEVESHGREEAIARQLLRRYGVVFRDLVAREPLAPGWRVLLGVYRRWEAAGEIRGGRFVAGFVGEQFALPEAVESLRAVRRVPEDREVV